MQVGIKEAAERAPRVTEMVRHLHFHKPCPRRALTGPAPTRAQSSGVQCSDECVAEFEQMKIRSTYQVPRKEKRSHKGGSGDGGASDSEQVL